MSSKADQTRKSNNHCNNQDDKENRKVCPKVASTAAAAAACVPRQVIQRKRKEFLDPQSRNNMARLNDDLADIHSIMKQNIEEVLNRGEKLDRKCESPPVADDGASVTAYFSSSSSSSFFLFFFQLFVSGWSALGRFVSFHVLRLLGFSLSWVA